VPKNGEANPKSGIYRTLCCGAEIVINAGSAFPDCPKHPKLTTIWKPVFPAINDKIAVPAEQQSAPTAEIHIENRRLFDLASGRFRPEKFEQEHLHGCELCQGVLYILMNQPLPGKSADAA
jgi:hypothetical protein